MCRIILKDRHDQVVCINGVVKRCEFIEATAHDIGVQFEKDIDIKDYVNSSTEEG